MKKCINKIISVVLYILLLSISIPIDARENIQEPIKTQNKQNANHFQYPKWKKQYDNAKAIYDSKNYPEAIIAINNAMQFAEKKWPKSLEVATSLILLGDIYQAQMNYKKAEPIYLHALNIRKQIHGINHLSISNTLNRLGSLHQSQKQYLKAESLFTQALTITEKTTDKNNILLTEHLDMLAKNHEQQMEYAKALPFSLRSLNISEKKLGKNHIDVATRLTNTARLYKLLGKFNNAHPLYQRALDIREKITNHSDSNVLISLLDLADIFYDLGDYDTSLFAYKKIMAINGSSKSENKSEKLPLIMTLNNLGRLYQALAFYADAEIILNRALEISEDYLDDHIEDDNEHYPYSLNNLANLYISLGNYAKAERLYNNALLFIEDKSLNTVQKKISYIGLGKLHFKKQQYIQAENYFEQATTLNNKTSKENFIYIPELINLANTYRNQGKYKQAESLYLQQLKFWADASLLSHPDRAMYLNELGALYLMKGDIDKAFKKINESLTIMKSNFPYDHPKIALVLDNIVQINIKKESYKEALELSKQTLEIKENKFGKYHPSVIKNLKNIALIYRKLRNINDALTYENRINEIQILQSSAQNLKITKEVATLEWGIEWNKAFDEYGSSKKQQLHDAMQIAATKMLTLSREIEHAELKEIFALNLLGDLYTQQKRYVDAGRMYKSILEILTPANSKENDNLAPYIGKLADAYYFQKKYDKALKLYLQELDIKEKTFGIYSISLINYLNKISDSYYKNNAIDQAILTERRALSILEYQAKSNPSQNLTDKRMITTSNSLASLYFQTKTFDLAEPLYKKVLKIRESSNASPIHIAQSLGSLAKVYYFQMNYEKSEIFYLRALAIWQVALSSEHTTIATILKNLSDVYKAQHLYGKAASTAYRAFKINQKIKGPYDRDVEMEMDNVVELYRNDRSEENYNNIKNIYLQNIKLIENELDENAPELIPVLKKLVAFYKEQNQYSQSKNIYKKLISILEKQLGADHPEVLTQIDALALLHRDNDQYDLAETLFKYNIETWNKLAMPPNATKEVKLKLAYSFMNLAILYRDNGKYSAAETLFKKTLTIYNQELSPEDTSLSTILREFARFYAIQGLHDKAIPLYYQLFPIWDKTKDYENERNIAQENKIKNQLSYQLIDKASKLRQNALGENHPYTLIQQKNNTILFKNQVQYDDISFIYNKLLSARKNQTKWNNSNQYLNNANDYEVFILLERLGDLHYEHNNLTQAELFYNESLPILENILKLKIRLKNKPKHYEKLVTILSRLAHIYLEKQDKDQVDKTYNRAYQITNEYLNFTNEQMLNNLNNLGKIAQARKKFSEAELLYSRALSIIEETNNTINNKSERNSPIHKAILIPEFLWQLETLAQLYVSQALYGKAETLYLRALTQCNQSYSCTQPYLINIYNELGNVYMKKGENTLAEENYNNMIKLLKIKYTDNHPYIAYALNKLALCYQNQSKFEEALAIFQHALNIFENQLTSSHPDVAITLTYLSDLYSQMNANNKDIIEKSKHFYSRANKIWQKLLGDHYTNNKEDLLLINVLKNTEESYEPVVNFER